MRGRGRHRSCQRMDGFVYPNNCWGRRVENGKLLHYYFFLLQTFVAIHITFPQPGNVRWTCTAGGRRDRAGLRRPMSSGVVHIKSCERIRCMVRYWSTDEGCVEMQILLRCGWMPRELTASAGGLQVILLSSPGAPRREVEAEHSEEMWQGQEGYNLLQMQRRKWIRGSGLYLFYCPHGRAHYRTTVGQSARSKLDMFIL